MRMYGNPESFITVPKTETCYVSGMTDALFFYKEMRVEEEKRKVAETKLENIEKSDAGKLNEAVYQLHKTLTNVQNSLDDIRLHGYNRKEILDKINRLQIAISQDIEIIMEDLYNNE